ncbi:MAG: sugar ABC transporter permease [Acidimicrobiales bacterium]
MLPAVAIFAMFIAFPVGFAAWLSFHQWNGFTSMGAAPNVGFANYQLLTQDPIFHEALKNTIEYTIASTTAQMVIAFMLAFTLWYYRMRFAVVLRALYFFPAVLSMVVIGLAWRQLLAPGGPIDLLMHHLGLPQVDFLGNTSLVLWVIVWVSTWQWSGWTMILYLAGMVGIPEELVEAATLDGAGGRTILRHIVIPSIRHVTALALLLNIVGGFQVFTTIYVMTGGGPIHASEVLGTYSWWVAFSGYGPGQLGYAAAIAMVMVVVLFVFSFIRVRLSRIV